MGSEEVGACRSHSGTTPLWVSKPPNHFESAQLINLYGFQLCLVDFIPVDSVDSSSDSRDNRTGFIRAPVGIAADSTGCTAVIVGFLAVLTLF